MADGGITREQKIARSILTFVKGALAGYPAGKVEVHEAFPYKDLDEATGIDKQHVAVGFQFDDGGSDGEMGSNFTRKLHTFEVYIFATTSTWAENLATRIAQTFEAARTVPLLDAEAGDVQIDTMVLEQVMAAKQPVREPRPWEHHVWVTTAKLWDEFYPDGD